MQETHQQQANTREEALKDADKQVDEFAQRVENNLKILKQHRHIQEPFEGVWMGPGGSRVSDRLSREGELDHGSIPNGGEYLDCCGL